MLKDSVQVCRARLCGPAFILLTTDFQTAALIPEAFPRGKKLLTADIPFSDMSDVYTYFSSCWAKIWFLIIT